MGYDPEFKFRVVLEALTRDENDCDIAREHGIHPVTLSRWKRRLLDDGPLVFETTERLGKVIESYESGRRAEVELEFLEMLVDYVCEHRLGLEDKVEIVEHFESVFGLNRMCRVVGLARSTWYYRQSPREDRATESQ
jgi:transposase-like protein